MKMLQNSKTKEIYPMNGDMARHEDVVVIDIPTMDKVTKRRGISVLEEDKPKPTRRKRASKAGAAETADVESPSPETETVGESGGDDAE